MEEKERYLVALAGLFHDVGKLADRSGERAGEGYEERFGYAHAKLSFDFMEKLLRDKLREEDYKVILSGAYHHKPEGCEEAYQHYAKIIQSADRNSSKERSKREEEEAQRQFKRLRPVFLGIKVEDFGYQEDRDYYIGLKPLELEKEILFPKEGRLEKGEEEYKELYEKLKEDIKKIDFSHLQKAFLKAYHTFYRYCWCVPASAYSAYDREKGTRHYKDKGRRHYPDISLFDHSRMLSAIACGLLTEYNKKEKIKKLILVDGDISGVQNFLFSLANVKGVAKRLRGRSFFLTMLPHLIARSMLWELGYPLCNLVYAGGGKFLVLLGYENGIEEKLRNFAKKVEYALIKAFGGKLGFVLSWISIYAEELTENFKDIMKKLYDEIDEQKRRKFYLTMKDFENLVKEKERGIGLCPSCRWEMLKEGQEVCDWCETFYKLGDALLKAEYVAFDDNREKFNDKSHFYLEGIGGVCLLEKEDQSFKEVYLINQTDFLERGVDGFLFFGKYVPKMEEGGKTADFETLAERAEGDKKIAFVLGDVDFLGFILQSIEEYSPSRLATLSRSLDLFFSGYLNTFLKDSNIYTLYSGGDDFFLIGPWDEMVDKILKLKEEFDEYTTYNPAINFSVGFHVDRPEAPVRFVGEYAEREEKKVKEEKTKKLEENGINNLPHFSILGELLTQDDLSKGLESAKSLIKLVEKREVGRSFLYRMYMLMRQYQEKKKGGGWWKFYPLFYYQLYRNVKDEHHGKLEEVFIDKSGSYNPRKNALFISKYVIMKTRGKDLSENAGNKS